MELENGAWSQMRKDAFRRNSGGEGFDTRPSFESGGRASSGATMQPLTAWVATCGASSGRLRESVGVIRAGWGSAVTFMRKSQQGAWFMDTAPEASPLQQSITLGPQEAQKGATPELPRRESSDRRSKAFLRFFTMLNIPFRPFRDKDEIRLLEAIGDESGDVSCIPHTIRNPDPTYPAPRDEEISRRLQRFLDSPEPFGVADLQDRIGLFPPVDHR